eukprot:5534517-Prymnesium_polylepis.1
MSPSTAFQAAAKKRRLSLRGVSARPPPSSDSRSSAIYRPARRAPCAPALGLKAGGACGGSAGAMRGT